MATSQDIQVQLAEAETALVSATDAAQVAALAAEVVKLKGELQVAKVAEGSVPVQAQPQAPAPVVTSIAPVQEPAQAKPDAAPPAPPPPVVKVAEPSAPPVVVIPKGLRISQLPVALRPTRN